MTSVFQLTQLKLLRLSGKDRLTFFNNLCVNNIDTMAVKQVYYSVICNPKGRIIFSFFIQKNDENLLLALDASLYDDFYNYLSMRKFRAAVLVEKDYKTALFLQKTSGEVTNNHFSMLSFAQLTGQPVVSDLEFLQFFFDNQYPWFNKLNSEKHIPQHVNLDTLAVIDFKKGCYPGQEIIARLHYLGKVKKRLKLINYQADSACLINAKVTPQNSKTTATIVSDSLCCDNYWQAQAIISL